MCSTFPAALRVRRTHLRRPKQNYQKAIANGSGPIGGAASSVEEFR